MMADIDNDVKQAGAFEVPNYKLCDACLQFKITASSFTSNPYIENRMHQVGSYQDVYDRKTCPLCQLIAEAYLEGPLPFGPKSSASWTKDLRIQGCWQQASDANTSCLRICLIQTHEDRKAFLVLRPLINDKLSKPHFAKKVTSPLFDFHSIRRWMTDCENGHKCVIPRSATARNPPLFRVVDVRKMCLVEPELGCRYFTLSYVWGTRKMFLTQNSNISELSRPGGLTKHWDELAPTIRDAIVLTAKLGEAYLWVDSLCIVQDGGIEMLPAIQSMGSIYGQAAAMICAADDSAGEHGLAGINLPRQPRQYIRNILPDLILTAQYYPLAYVESSVYATRGWTYQEEQLAPRIIYLVNNQVYFTCLENLYAEDVGEPTSVSTGLALVIRANARKPADGSTSALSLRYFHAVQIYSIRNLTQPNDIQKAFAGVLGTHLDTFRTTSNFGLPTCFFDLALLWQPAAQMKRRKGYPSWSWQGWFGGVRWLGDTMELSSYGNFASRKQELDITTKWHVKHTWISWRRWAHNGPYVWTAETNIDDPEGLNDIGYRKIYSSPENPYGRKRDDDINGICVKRPQFVDIYEPSITHFDSKNKPVSDPDGLLYFSTLSAYFRIRPSNAYLKYGTIDPNWDPQGRVIFHVLNGEEAVCGYVMLDETYRQIYLNTPNIEYEFLMLSDANYHCEWGRPHEGHPYKKSWDTDAYIEYHAIMVVTLPNTPDGAVERAGLGRIHQEALKDAWSKGPVWKEVVLG